MNEGQCKEYRRGKMKGNSKHRNVMKAYAGCDRFGQSRAHELIQYISTEHKMLDAGCRCMMHDKVILLVPCLKLQALSLKLKYVASLWNAFIC